MTQLNKIVWESKKYFFNICLLLVCLNLNAKSLPLKELAVISDKSPVELKLITQHLAQHVRDHDEASRIIAYCNLINDDLKSTPKSNVFFMLKSEVYRVLLKNQYLKKENKLQVSSSLITSVEQKLSKFDIVYSKFSRWIIQSLLDDLAPFKKDQMIDQYQRVSRTDLKKMAIANRLKKILSYTTPWLEKIEKLSPESFNKLVTNISIDLLWHVSSRSYYFASFASKFKQVEPTLVFKVPSLKSKVLESKKLDLKQKQLDAKEKAKKFVKSIDADDLSSASKQIDSLDIQEKSTWKPR